MCAVRGAQPAIAEHEIRLSGLHHLRGDLGGNAGDDRVEARYVPWLRDLRDDRLAFARPSGELHFPGAEDKNPRDC